MGSYGIGVERILAAVIEQNHDENSIVRMRTVAQFNTVITVTNIKQPELVEVKKTFCVNQKFLVVNLPTKFKPG